MTIDSKIKSKVHSMPQQADADKQKIFKEIAGLLIFIAIVLIAYYVALNPPQA